MFNIISTCWSTCTPCLCKAPKVRLIHSKWYLCATGEGGSVKSSIKLLAFSTEEMSSISLLCAIIPTLTGDGTRVTTFQIIVHLVTTPSSGRYSSLTKFLLPRQPKWVLNDDPWKAFLSFSHCNSLLSPNWLLPPPPGHFKQKRTLHARLSMFPKKC